MSRNAWARIEIIQTAGGFDLVGVATCGAKWQAATVPTRVEARSRGRDLAAFLECALVDGTTAAAALPAESGMRRQRWG